jgi:hypothetical protein
MTTILQRVCWNTDFWTKPSGATADSGNPGRVGFGNEEWNFCRRDRFDGNVYGWLYWKAKGFEKKHFQILFWTIRPPRKEWLLVGAYRDASLVTPEDARNLRGFFKENKIDERRFSEALDAVTRADKKRDLPKHRPAKAKDLRFKCPLAEMEIFEPYIDYRALPKKFRSNNARFGHPTIIEAPLEEVLNTIVEKRRSDPDFAALNLLEDVYQRATPASIKIIRPLHKELCNKFIRWLHKTGRIVLGREKERVDVEFQDGRQLCRAELKVCYGMVPRFAIREALGQLLEYNYYGWRAPADHWFIVLDMPPTPADVTFVRALSKKKGLPLSLCWVSENGFATN